MPLEREYLIESGFPEEELENILKQYHKKHRRRILKAIVNKFDEYQGVFLE